MLNKQVILLVGAARHSTNLIANLLNVDGSYEGSVEPFRLRGEAGMFSFARWKYILSHDHDPKLLKLAEDILTGAVENLSAEQDHASRVGLLVQELRAHLWLGGLRANFPEVRIVLLFRHPLAVISSRVTFEWRSYLSQTLSQAELLADHLAEFRSCIEGARTDLERHTVAWCIQHYVALRQFTRGEIHLAFFENLVRQPEELQRLFLFVGRPFDHHMSLATQRLLSAKSIDNGVSHAWRKHLSSDDVERANTILCLFGLDRIYGDREIADVSAAEDIMRN